MSDQEVLKHYGTPRKSGRYPWGSGEDPYQRGSSFLAYADELKKSGMSDVEIAKAMGISTGTLRARRSIARDEVRKENIAQILRMKDKGVSNVEIGKRLGIPESTVRSYLDPAKQARAEITMATSKVLKDKLSEDGYLDVGTGTEQHLGISATKLNSALAQLVEEGYTIHTIDVEQVGNLGNYTKLKVLAPPGTTKSDVWKNRENIKNVDSYSEDGGKTYQKVQPPVDISVDRVAVRYGPEGGAKADGLIELRRGVDDISLGQKNYAQVRISVDGTHYIKGMAMYSDDLPDGVDIRFNSNKSSTGNKLDALKPIKRTAEGEVDPDLPFGAVVRQKTYLDKDGNLKRSALNIVNEEGDWNEWSRSLSSQMLSKQSVPLAKKQLNLGYLESEDEFATITSLTNPTVRKDLLLKFADSCDADSVHLKAAALPRQASKVILPITTLKDNEIYAPTFKQGEEVVLIRYPHGGIFEIPNLKVNNKHTDSKRLIGNTAQDAVGINHRVAARLSGADFDGDTVLVIPNRSKSIQTAPALERLKNFNPEESYPPVAGMAKMGFKVKKGESNPMGFKPGGNTQTEMGRISNLITDMTIRRASEDEIARAVRHSMVVIDAEKKGLNYKQSYEDNGIAALKERYQRGANAGASTLISMSKSEARPLKKKLANTSEGGPIDKKTGEKVYVLTGEGYVKKNKAGESVFVPRTQKSTKMAETKDAHTLSSGTVMEYVYAEHANKLKALANKARKEAVNTPPLRYSPSARTAYAPEVASLKAKLNNALKNAPRERQAQLVANLIVDAKRKDNPEMEPDQLKKIRNQALKTARERTGAKKDLIKIQPKEWAAIQAGAISDSMLTKILNNTDAEIVKELAMPRASTTIPRVRLARAKAMLDSGYTQAEVADALGVGVSTLSRALKEE